MLHGEHAVRESPQPVEVEVARHELGEDGEALLGPRRARMTDGEDRQVHLGPAVDAGPDVDVGLVVEELGGVAPREHRSTADLDPGGGRRRVRGQLVDDEHLRRVGAEVDGDRRFDLGGDVLGGPIAGRIGEEVLRGELVDRGEHRLGEQQRRRRVDAQRPRRHAVQLGAVLGEAPRADRREQQRGGLDRVGFPAEPVVDRRSRPQRPTHRPRRLRARAPGRPVHRWGSGPCSHPTRGTRRAHAPATRSTTGRASAWRRGPRVVAASRHRPSSSSIVIDSRHGQTLPRTSYVRRRRMPHDPIR